MEGFDNLQQGEDDFPLSLLYFSDTTFVLKSKWSGNSLGVFVVFFSYSTLIT